MTGDFYFVPPQEEPEPLLATAAPAPATTKTALAAPSQYRADEEMWKELQDSDSAEDFEDFLAAFPESKLAPVARIKLKRLKRKQAKAKAEQQQLAEEAKRLEEERKRLAAEKKRLAETQRKAVKMTVGMQAGIESLLRRDWSLEQITGRLKQQGRETACHETIHQHVLKDKRSGGELHLHLHRHQKKYRKHCGSVGNRSGIPNRMGIEARPEAANRRERFGDWEADTMIGKGHRGALVTLDERKSKLRLALPVANNLNSPYRISIQPLVFSDLKGVP